MKSFLTLLLCFSSVACVTTKRFDQNYRTQVKEVTISSEKLPEFTYYGPGAAFKTGLGAALGGAVGGAIAGTATDDSDDTKFKAAFQQAGFDPAVAIAQSFSRKIKEKSNIVTRDEGQADAKISIQITNFGLGKGWGFADQTKPMMSVTFAMTDPSTGHLIWQDNLVIDTVSDEAKYHSYEEWLGDPNLLKSEFLKSIDVLTDKAVSSMGS
jgi:hypothetical protein